MNHSRLQQSSLPGWKAAADSVCTWGRLSRRWLGKRHRRLRRIKPDQARSSPIKPNQAMNLHPGPFDVTRCRATPEGTALSSGSLRLMGNPVARYSGYRNADFPGKLTETTFETGATPDLVAFVRAKSDRIKANQTSKKFNHGWTRMNTDEKRKLNNKVTK